MHAHTGAWVLLYEYVTMYKEVSHEVQIKILQKMTRTFTKILHRIYICTFHKKTSVIFDEKKYV